MGSFTTDYAETILDQLTGTDALYLALFTSDPADTGDVTDEVSATNYAREDMGDNNDKFETAGNTAAREINSNSDVQFAEADSSWGTISYMGLCAAGTGGTSDMKLHGALSTSKSIESGDQLVFKSGNITLSVASG